PSSAAASQQPATAPGGQSAPQRSAAAPASPPPSSPAPGVDSSIFDPASIPKLMEITPPAPTATRAAGRVPPPPDTPAALTREDVAAFKQHLRKCLRVPAGVDADRPVRIVMRVLLKRNGSLAADPMLVSAPAAQEGPSLVEAATSALKACQPYALPADKYDEWK